MQKIVDKAVLLVLCLLLSLAQDAGTFMQSHPATCDNCHRDSCPCSLPTAAPVGYTGHAGQGRAIPAAHHPKIERGVFH